MNLTEQFFIQCLSDHLNRRETVLPETDIDLAALYRLAQTQELAGAVYYQLRGTGWDTKQFADSFYAALFYSTGRQSCLDAVKQRFAEQDIEFVPVKGISIAKYYPVPRLRTMGDIDLLIREADKEKIHQVMLDLGYRCKSRENSRDWDYVNHMIMFEMHPLLIYPDEQVEKKVYAEYFNDFWQHLDENGEPEPEFHLLFLLVHLRKHTLNHGAGIRHFTDIAAFTAAEPPDWDRFRARLEALELTTFAETVYAFLKRWFGLETPLSGRPLDEDFYQESTDRILRGGVFGFLAEDDEQALVSYAAAKYGAAGKLRYYLRMAFPGAGVLRLMKEYAYLTKRPWLLPFAWLCRGLRVLTRGDMREKMASMKAETSPDRVKMISSWGMR